MPRSASRLTATNSSTPELPVPLPSALPASESKPYSIRKFFAGKTIFLTGCTGLVGKAILEKLLRTIPEVHNLKLLIRSRLRAGRRVSAPERFRDEVLTNPLFDTLRQEHGKRFDEWIAGKVTCIDGDVLKADLGLSEQTWSELADHVDVVIHSAATVNLIERIDLALDLNVGGPMAVLRFARAARSSMIHVSTAYVSGCRRGRVLEELLEPIDVIKANMPDGGATPQSFDVVEEIDRLKTACQDIWREAENVPHEENCGKQNCGANEWVVRRIKQLGLDRARDLGWLDPYGYTKFLGEQMLRLHHREVPLAIVRPAIIESALREPEPGWLQNCRMADPVFLNYGKGHFEDFPGRSGAALDLVPVDLVVNGILAVAAYLDKNQGECPVMHLATSGSNPLTLSHLHLLLREYFTKNPMYDNSGQPIAVPEWVYPEPTVYAEQLQLRITGLKRQLKDLQQGDVAVLHDTKARRRQLRVEIGRNTKLQEIADLYAPYTTLQCRFDDTQAIRIRTLMAPPELATYDFASTLFTWEHYLCNVHLPGVSRRFLRVPDR